MAVEEYSRENRVGDGLSRLLEVLHILVRFKKLILATVASAFVISVIVSLLLPKTYQATASIFPPQQDMMSFSSQDIAKSMGVGSVMGSFLGLKSPSDLWVGVLKSNAVKDLIIEKFKLRERYEANTIEDTRAELEKRLRISKSKDEIIHISVEDEDPQMAAEIANAFVLGLDEINTGMAMTSGKRSRLFLEKRLDQARGDLLAAASAFKMFQEKNKAIKLDEQSKVMVETMASLKGQLISKELELKMLSSYASPENPMVEALKREVRELGLKLKETEDGNGAGKSFFIPTSRIPNLTAEYVERVREIKIQETLFELLTQQYELAKIQESKDTPTVQLLSKASAPERKYKPKRGLIVALSTLAAVFVSMSLAFFINYLGGSGVGRYFRVNPNSR